ncbi:hypothetical protein DFS33DRAFT_1274120 [Desarmillaria ectypa]|nr:hypothetical protein DFS33DRAFT_1274120 [Desarmillaria ectypa]
MAVNKRRLLSGAKHCMGSLELERVHPRYASLLRAMRSAKFGTEDGLRRRVSLSVFRVLVHPFFSLRTLEAFAIGSMKESSTRNKIMCMIRSNNRAKNGGRRVLNESALLDAIRALLEERGKDEELVFFDEMKYGSVSEIFDYLNKNVMAVVGPYGGAMHRHRWVAQGTLVIEIMPMMFKSVAVYEEASVLSQTYAALIVEPSSPEDGI